MCFLWRQKSCANTRHPEEVMGSDPLRALLALWGEFILEQDAIVYVRERSLFGLDLTKFHYEMYFT